MKKLIFIITRYLQYIKEKIEDYNFNNRDDWEIKKIGFKIVKTLYITFFRFTKDNCVLHASALAYTSLLSLVPILALMFSLLKGMNVEGHFLEMLVKLIAANQQVIADSILSYLDNTNATKLGTIGALSLIVTAILVLTTIEKSFNVIWGVKNTRNTIRKLADYLSALIIGPTLFVGALSATALIKLPSFLENIGFINLMYAKMLEYTPYLLMWIAFTFFYSFIPNTKVKIIPALIGGLVASLLWQSAQLLYINFNEYMVNIKIIYGGLAALPLFLMWIYISWVILLFGAELSFAVQNVTNYRSSIENVKLSPFEFMQLSIIIMYYICKSFYNKNAKDITIRSLSIRLNLSDRVINYIVTNLSDAGLLAIDSSSQEQMLVPRIDPTTIKIKDVVNAIINTNKKSIITALQPDIDSVIYEKIAIFNKQDFLINMNFKELTEQEK